MENIMIGAAILLTGVVLLAMGFARRSSAGALKAVPCRYVSALVPGERQFITGKARSGVRLESPVSKKDCVFYREQVEQYHAEVPGDRYRLELDNNRRGALRGGWEVVSDNFNGAFFVDDPTGAALVVPSNGSLDLRKQPLTMDESLERRRTELVILQGETVSALGFPRRIDELIKYLRQAPGGNLSTELVAELMKMERDPAYASLHCFFGQGLERVTDQPCSDYIAGTGNSASSLLQAGGVLAVAGAAFLLYSLKNLLGAPPDIG